MKKPKALYSSIIFLFLTFCSYADIPDFDIDNAKFRPKRIIRTCCAFGVDVKMAGLPFIKFTDITAVNHLGPHSYLGNDKEGNGIIYTHKAGFVDIGHARDMADWTLFLYKLIQKNQTKPTEKAFRLGYEGGTKELTFQLPENLSKSDAAKLAARIAYDLSVWHEIATWYGTSYIPLVPERYSAFSVEDAYSNLWGTHIGYQAIMSDLPYEKAVDQIIAETLVKFEAVESIEKTTEAMNAVKDVWWSGKAQMPSGKVLIKREFNVYGNPLSPRLLPTEAANETYALEIFDHDAEGRKFVDMYLLKFKLNYKFPAKQVSQTQSKEITHKEFQKLIDFGTSLHKKKFPVDKSGF